jgi:hypothetical protein
VDSHSRIGIYLRKDKATVACLASQGRERKLLDAFSVTVEDQGQQNQQVLADQIAKCCSDRRIKAVEASVALDCALFMQHRLHSDFSDVKKIEATVRFDAEETLATDISDLAVAFRVVSSGESGSELDVFTAERSVLTDILLSQQSNGIDPLTVEPDICPLSRYLCEVSASSGDTKDSVLFALLSDCRGYLVGIAQAHTTMMRAFPINPAQDRNELLAREILLSAALAESPEPPQKLYVVNAAGDLDIESLQTKLKLPVESYDLIAGMGAEPPKGTDSPNTVDLAVAFGAALPKEERTSVNFRNDHMPHLGKKMRLYRAVQFASIALTILGLSLGVYFQTLLINANQDRQKLLDFLKPRYIAVMLDKNLVPKTMKDALTSLQGLLRRINQEKSGQMDQESVSAKLGLVLEALNSCTAATDLKIESVTIDGTRTIVVGNTSSRANTEKVFAAMPKAGLELGHQAYQERNGRDTFSMTLTPVAPMKQEGK